MLPCTIILLVALAGGLLPLLVKWTHRLLHVALALSTGIFLGAVFLHLLPSIAAIEPVVDDHAHEHAHAHGDVTIWFYVLAGVLAVYLVEALIFRTDHTDDLHHHRSVGFAAFFGLSVHALTAGLGYSAAALHSELAGPVLISLVAHKGFEAFSLASVFLLAEFSRRRIILFMVLFSCITPAGVLLGGLLMDQLTDHGIAMVTALAAGTFLYVCLSELLPEVFHHKEDSLAKVALIAVGVASMALFEGFGA